MLDSIVKLAKEVLGPEPVLALAMAVLAGLFAYAYWGEKQQKEALQKERHEEMKAQLEDAKEETKEMTEAVMADELPARKVGMRSRDVLVALGRYYPRTLEELGQLLEHMVSGDQVSVTYLRVKPPTIFRYEDIIQVR